MNILLTRSIKHSFKKKKKSIKHTSFPTQFKKISKHLANDGSLLIFTMGSYNSSWVKVSPAHQHI